MEVGKAFNQGSYGIPIPKGSPYKDLMSQVILTMREDGFMDKIYQTWWIDKGTCTAAPKTTNRFNLRNLGGVWVLLAIFVGIAFLILIFEYIYFITYTKCKHHSWVYKIMKYGHRFLGGKREVLPTTVKNVDTIPPAVLTTQA